MAPLDDARLSMWIYNYIVRKTVFKNKDKSLKRGLSRWKNLPPESKDHSSNSQSSRKSWTLRVHVWYPSTSTGNVEEDEAGEPAALVYAAKTNKKTQNPRRDFTSTTVEDEDCDDIWGSPLTFICDMSHIYPHLYTNTCTHPIVHTNTHHEKSNFKISSNRSNYYTKGFAVEATEGKLLDN